MTGLFKIKKAGDLQSLLSDGDLRRVWPGTRLGLHGTEVYPGTNPARLLRSCPV
jgi:hypothetical protein